jgi:hypothetical protein
LNHDYGIIEELHSQRRREYGTVIVTGVAPASKSDEAPAVTAAVRVIHLDAAVLVLSSA